MDKKNELTQEEELLKEQGMALEEMMETPGFKVLEGWLTDLAFHSWVDPRECSREEWQWRELNAFHAANMARELLERISSSISQAKALVSKQKGEVGVKSFRI